MACFLFEMTMWHRVKIEIRNSKFEANSNNQIRKLRPPCDFGAACEAKGITVPRRRPGGETHPLYGRRDARRYRVAVSRSMRPAPRFPSGIPALSGLKQRR